MSLPDFPDKNQLPSREEAINQIISSIAMEELGLSHIINAEGEKIQYALGSVTGVSGPAKPLTIAELLALNQSIHKTLDSAMMNQFFLKEKLTGALAASVMQGPTGATGSPGVTGATGSTGMQGMAATINVVGPATRVPFTDNPFVYNDGTEQNALFRFEIPAGDPGVTPHIDANTGHWFIGVTDTGVPAQGPKGDTGPVVANIPFCLSKHGISLSTDAQGDPIMVAFSGFGSSYYDTATYLAEGEWAGGTITIREDMHYGSAFIMPYNGILKKVYVLFSTGWGVRFEENASIRPFVGLAVSNADTLVFNILHDTLTFTAPYDGGIDYPRHTLRKGLSANLDIAVAEGTLVAIIAGIMGENLTCEQQGEFSVSGGLYWE